MTVENTDVIMNQPGRVQALRRVAETVANGAAPLVDLYRPYVDGLHNLPTDGRFLLVGNHTQFGAEALLIPLLVRRAIGRRVRPLTDKNFGRMGGLPGDLLAAIGAVVGAPETARELMVHDEPILVFPGGGREIAKFKGEEYTLRWQGRTGFARLAVEYSYPIVPVGLVGGDDVYRSMTTREGRWGRLSQSLTERLSGRSDMAMPLMRGIGPTLIPGRSGCTCASAALSRQPNQRASPKKNGSPPSNRTPSNHWNKSLPTCKRPAAATPTVN